MKTQRSDTEKSQMIEEGKRLGINKISRQNAQVESNVILLCKVQKKTENISPKTSETINCKTMILSNYATRGIKN